MWKEGTIGVPNKGGKYTVVHYWAKVFDEDSVYGINEGRISKLMLKQNGEIVYNYDRGLDIAPADGDTDIALAILLKDYN